MKQKEKMKENKKGKKSFSKKSETKELSAQASFGTRQNAIDFHNGNFDRNKNATDITFESVYAI